LCPACLLEQGLASVASLAVDSNVVRPTVLTPPSGGFVPPEPETLAGYFPQLQILELLGHGGMGAVYKARQANLDRLVALKIIRPESADDPAFAERFNREARTLARLNHPHIVAVHDFGKVAVPQSDGKPRTLFYFLMEYVDGASLRTLIDGTELSPEQALAVVPQICDALQYAHDEGVVHRDIKPENVLVDKRGRVKIADFGLAKLAGQSADYFTLTGTHQVMGTPRYMAPEQMEGSHAVDHRADIYSLGVVFYEMLTGQVPAGHFDPPSKKVQIDVRLDEVVLRSLAREPERRYQQASEVKTDVESISQGQSGTPVVAAMSSVETARAPAVAVSLKRQADMLILAAAVALVTAVASAGWLWFAPAAEVADRGARASGIPPVSFTIKAIAGHHALYAVLIGLAAFLMRGLRARLVTLLVVFIVGVVLPAAIIVNVVMEYRAIPVWPLMLPQWLAMPVAMWAVVTQFQLSTQHSYERRHIAGLASSMPDGAAASFPWSAFWGGLVILSSALLLIAFVAGWMQSAWMLLALVVPWFVLACCGAATDGQPLERVVNVLAVLAAPVSLGLIGYGVWLTDSAWPLAIVPLAVGAMFAGASLTHQMLAEDEAEESDESPAEGVEPAMAAAPPAQRHRPRGTLGCAWDAWWSERDRWFTNAVQSLIAIAFLVCLIMYLSFSTKSERVEGEPSLRSTVVNFGVPSPWFHLESYPEPNVPFRWTINWFASSSAIMLLGLALWYVYWQIEKAKAAAEGKLPHWSNSPQAMIGVWAVLTVAAVAWGFHPLYLSFGDEQRAAGTSTPPASSEAPADATAPFSRDVP
jgi:tRNA A-37 threonylcarbamoyl transferase component Bud32